MKESTENYLHHISPYARTVATLLRSEVVDYDTILGAIGEEYESRSIKDELQEWYVKGNWSHQEIANAYIESKNEEHLERSFLLSSFNPMHNDVGVANINIRTAIDSLHEYADLYKDSDPLNLKRYLNDYSLMVEDLIDRNNMLSVAIAGLHLMKAEKSVASSYQWGKRNLADKKATVITMYNNGIEKTVRKNK